MKVASRIILLNKNNPDQPLGSFVVPGLVSPEDIRKSIKLSVTVIVPVGDGKKKKKKTITVGTSSGKKSDPELIGRLNQLLENYIIRIVREETNEEVLDEIALSDVEEAE